MMDSKLAFETIQDVKAAGRETTGHNMKKKWCTITRGLLMRRCGSAANLSTSEVNHSEGGAGGYQGRT